MASPNSQWHFLQQLAALLILWPVGCANESVPANPAESPVSSPDKLLAQLDETLESTFHRRLNLEEHAAWQILHGALAYQQEFLVEKNPGGERVPAVSHLLGGGRMNGWTTEPGKLDEESGTRGLRAVLEAGTKAGQGHADQWLAVLSQCDLAATQPILVDGDTYTMSDYVRQVQWDIARNLNREYSWTLIGLTTYLPTDASWVAEDGRTWSIEQLVQLELEQELASSACGGSHRLIGLAMALNRHLAEGGELNGVWERADAQIQQAISDAHRLQNADGSFSTNYFARPGHSPDLAQNLGTTGHTLEFLALAMTDEQLKQPWVQRAVSNLCELFASTRNVALECGKLYHAAHGLALYRQRVFGQRSYGG